MASKRSRDLQGRRAVVTGSSSGIGRAIAIELAACGAEVIVHAHRSADAAAKVCEEIERAAGKASVVLCDLGDAIGREQLVDAAWENGPIQIWVNNAGVDLLTEGRFELPYEDKLEALLRVDVSASILLSREVGRRMLLPAAGSGDRVILNMGWDQAASGMGGDSGELFAAAKGAVMSFTRSLAVSLAPKVRVNCLAPGWIKTAWGETADSKWERRVLQETPAARWGSPEDVAYSARFLVSEQASYLTGQVVNVNGGAIR